MSLTYFLLSAPPAAEERVRAIYTAVETTMRIGLVDEPAQPGVRGATSDDDAHSVALALTERPGELAPGRSPLLEIAISVPADTDPTRIVAVLSQVGDAAHAYWGTVSPENAGAAIAEQTIHKHVATTPPHGLPPLHPPHELRAPEIPPRLGWLVYWSDGAAKTVGFPDRVRDVDLLVRTKRTKRGWVVAMTEDPLDFEHPDHVATLRSIYDRFPMIGGRDT